MCGGAVSQDFNLKFDSDLSESSVLKALDIVSHALNKSEEQLHKTVIDKFVQENQATEAMVSIFRESLDLMESTIEQEIRAVLLNSISTK